MNDINTLFNFEISLFSYTLTMSNFVPKKTPKTHPNKICNNMYAILST